MATNAQEFAEVYQRTLPSVWQFVSSRIPDYEEAQDVTSEVFTRAWQSWSRYDPARGSPNAWMCGIAQRTVADWWRKRRPERVEWEQAETAEGEMRSFDELLPADTTREPEQALLQKEFVAQVRAALHELNARERDAMALRFGAGLQANEIAVILELSLGATKMVLRRTIIKLRELLKSPSETVSLQEAESLDDAVSDVLARRRASVPDPLMERMLRCLAVIHRAPVPPQLPKRVMACVECGSIQDAQVRTGAKGLSLFARLGLVVPPTLRAATIPSCIVCAAAPILLAPITALGLLEPATVLHEALVFLAPLNLYLLWRGYRRHREPTGFVLGAMGVVLILVHLSTHVLDLGADINNITLRDLILIGVTIWVGSTLLLAASLIDWRARRRFVMQLRAGFAM